MEMWFGIKIIHLWEEKRIMSKIEQVLSLVFVIWLALFWG